VKRLPLVPDSRSDEEQVAALDQARRTPEAMALLDQALEAVGRALKIAERTGPHLDVPRSLWAELDFAFECIDGYIARLFAEAELRPSCRDRCSACCSEAAGALPIEALRMVRKLRGRADASIRFQRCVDQARAFQKILLQHSGPRPRLDVASQDYRRAHLEWRRRQQPCPVLGDDGRCVAYAERPVACRIHFSLADPFHCEPTSPLYAKLRPPQLWVTERERSFDAGLHRIGDALGLPASPNLMWGIARLHDSERLDDAG
jgi:Fe-S-cluster containining protein